VKGGHGGASQGVGVHDKQQRGAGARVSGDRRVGWRAWQRKFPPGAKDEPLVTRAIIVEYWLLNCAAACFTLPRMLPKTVLFSCMTGFQNNFRVVLGNPPSASAP
jgi:hypothetical protein